jgi:hypothetical protein
MHQRDQCLGQRPEDAVSDDYKQRVDLGKQQLCRLFAQLDSGGVPDFCVLADVPGVRLDDDAVTYEEAVALIADGSVEALGRLGRSPLAIKHYWSTMDKLKQEYASVADYLYKRVFGMELQAGKDGRLRAVVPAGWVEGPEEVVAWCENDFPYHLAAGVRHYNLWCNRPLPAERVEEEIERNLGVGMERVWFINPPALKSVPAIWHAHIIARDPVTSSPP